MAMDDDEAELQVDLDDDVTSEFASYEDYLDRQITPVDMYYLENKELARQLIEHGYRGNAEILTREEFEARKRAAESARLAKMYTAPEELASANKSFDGRPLLAALAQREEALRSGKLTTIVYVRHTNGAGQEVSGYIDIADRLKTENLEAVFAGKRLLIPKVRMDPRPCARATNCQGLRGPALTPLGTRVRTHTNARRRVTSHTTTGIRRQARRRPRQTSR